MLHMYTHTVRSQLICACDRFLHTVMYSVDARDPERFWGLGGYISQLQGDVLLEVHLIRICSVHETSSVFSCDAHLQIEVERVVVGDERQLAHRPHQHHAARDPVGLGVVRLEDGGGVAIGRVALAVTGLQRAGLDGHRDPASIRMSTARAQRLRLLLAQTDLVGDRRGVTRDGGSRCGSGLGV